MASLRKYAAIIVTASLALLALLSAVKVVQNHRAFDVVETRFATSESDPGWAAVDYPATEFREVDLPFFLSSGNFRVSFDSTRQNLKLNVFAVDCLSEVYLDGQQVFTSAERCKPCDVWHAWSSKRCRADEVSLPLTAPGRHVLGIKTQNIKKGESNQLRDVKLLFLHYRNAAFGWRVLGLVSLAALGWLLVSYIRTRDALRLPLAHLRALARHRALVLILAFSLLPKLVIAPSFMSTDIGQSALIYTENLVNKKDWHFAALDSDYEAAKYWGKSHMHKPPGVYYQYAVPRLLFGFTEAYFPGMARLPGMLGDILIGWVIWALVRAKRGDWEATLAAGMFVLSTGVFFTTGYVGRIDSLAIGLLLLALWQGEKSPNGNVWFSIFLGAAVAWKQLALLILPFILTPLRRFKWLALAGAVTLLLCAPYLLDDPKLFLERLILPQLEKEAGGVSWLINLERWGVKDQLAVSKLITLGYMLTLCLLPLVTRLGPWLGGAVAFGLFVATTKNVYEHYIMWSMPFMVIVLFLQRSTVALVAFALGTLTMTLRTERITFLESDIAYDWAILIGATFFVTCVYLIVTSRGFSQAPVGKLLGYLRDAYRARQHGAKAPSPALPPHPPPTDAHG